MKGVQNNESTYYLTNTRTVLSMTTRDSLSPAVSISLYCILLCVVSSSRLLSECGRSLAQRELRNFR
jgi:hypothetical protein